jgi:hypothetical protein
MHAALLTHACERANNEVNIHFETPLLRVRCLPLVVPAEGTHRRTSISVLRVWGEPGERSLQW